MTMMTILVCLSLHQRNSLHRLGFVPRDNYRRRCNGHDAFLCSRCDQRFLVSAKEDRRRRRPNKEEKKRKLIGSNNVRHWNDAVCENLSTPAPPYQIVACWLLESYSYCGQSRGGHRRELLLNAADVEEELKVNPSCLFLTESWQNKRRTWENTIVFGEHEDATCFGFCVEAATIGGSSGATIL